MDNKETPTYLFVLGPTGTGKTEFSLKWAQKMGWPILNCDSVQTYQKVQIGAAKPTPQELELASHYLFDFVKPPGSLTAADYLQSTLECIRDNQLHHLTFVGGSGFYVQALEKGLYAEAEVTVELKQEVRHWLMQEGKEKLYQWIQERDPDFAKKISLNDEYRLLRAVEVMKSTGLTMTAVKRKMELEKKSPLPKHRSLKIGFNQSRDQLRKRIIKRTTTMLESGLLEEVSTLRAQGLGSWAPMQSVGYKEVQMHLDGQLEKSLLHEAIVTSTMQLIKKQQTWFKRDAEITWFAPGQIQQAMDWCLEQF